MAPPLRPYNLVDLMMLEKALVEEKFSCTGKFGRLRAGRSGIQTCG